MHPDDDESAITGAPPITHDPPVKARKSQEQTQIIARAMGKATAKVPAIVRVNAESKFPSGRTLSFDMLPAPPRETIKCRHPDEAIIAFWLAHTVSRSYIPMVPGDGKQSVNGGAQAAIKSTDNLKVGQLWPPTTVPLR